MDQDQQEPTLEESLKEVMKTLPPVIRTYLSQGKYTAVAQSLAGKYGLRIDQAGVLEREIMLLLMGIETPDEFVQALVDDAQLERGMINSIAEDVNERIFVPLRQEEEKRGMGSVAPSGEGVAGVAKPAAPSAAPRESAPPRPLVAPVPAGIASGENLRTGGAVRSSVAPHSAPLPPKGAMPQAAATSAPAKPLGSGGAIEDREEPRAALGDPLMPPVVRRPAFPVNLLDGKPRSALESGSVPEVPGSRPYISHPPLPSKEESVVPKADPATPPTLPTVPPRPAAAPAAPSPVGAYSVDPYREPIDEPEGNR